MRSVTTCILSVLFTFISFISVVIPYKDKPKPVAEPSFDQTKTLVLASTDLFGLMENNPFTAVGLYTLTADGKSNVVFLPCWNDIDYVQGLAGDRRRYYIFNKVIDALSQDGIWQLRIVPLAKSTNAKA